PARKPRWERPCGLRSSPARRSSDLNATHASTTDPEARLARKGKGQEAKLFYTGHVLMENRNGLAVGGCVLPASGYAERAAALDRSEEHTSELQSRSDLVCRLLLEKK